MRKFTLIATAMVLLANATWVVETHAQWPQTTMPDPRFTVEFGAKAYDRPGSQSGIPLITDGITSEVLFNSTQAEDLGNTAGAEVKFNFMTKLGREIQVRSIIADWDQSFEFAGGSLVTSFLPPAATTPSLITYDTEADYFSIEIMARKSVSPGITVTCGPRYVSSKDLITFSVTNPVDPGAGGTAFDVVSTQTTEASNGLIGFQSGCEFNIPVAQDVYVNSFIRVGGYMNPTEVSTSTTDDFSNVVSTTTLTETTGSFLGEVGGRLYVDIVPNCFSTYLGYEATWIDGIALAPAHVVATGLTGVDTANTTFFQALTFGARFTY